MRSGNGRHRRPRQAPALFVAAGVTGAGIAIPLLGASGAQAADAATWDRVAECESGGIWSSNPDSGYYGGLQLTQETWDEYGGKDFAERPDLASRGQQISVAEKILADKGPAAWPRCAVEGGLGEGQEESPDPEPEPEPSDDPSSEPTPSPSEPSEPNEPSEPSDPADSTPTPTPTPTPSTPEDPAPSTPGDPESGSPSPTSPSPTSPSPTSPSPTSPAPSAPESGSPGTDAPSEPSPGYPGYPGGPHRSDPPQEPAPDDGEGTGRHRGEPDEREGRDGKTPERPSRGDKDGDGKDDQDDYRVGRGDSLSAIAAELGVEGGWPALYAANREAVGSDPDLILPGQQLHL